MHLLEHTLSKTSLVPETSLESDSSGSSSPSATSPPTPSNTPMTAALSPTKSVRFSFDHLAAAAATPATTRGGMTSSRSFSARTLSQRSLSRTVLERGQSNSPNFSLMGYASPSIHDIQELRETLEGFEKFYQEVLSSVQMDLRQRAPLKIEIKSADKGLVNPQPKSFFSRAVSYEAPEEVIQVLKKKAPEHEEFIRHVRTFSRSSVQDASEFLKGHSQLLRKLHARLIQTCDAYPENPGIHREYSRLARRILDLQLFSRPDVEDGTLGSSLSSSRLFSSLKPVERIPFTSERHADWVKDLFSEIEGPFTDANRGGLLQLSAIEEHFDELNRGGKEAVAVRLTRFLKENFNIDLQDFKRDQVFSPEALTFFSEILTTILPAMGLESDDWVEISSSEFPEDVQHLLEELEITILEREGKCAIFSKSLDDFGVTDGYVRNCVNTPLGALTSEMDPKKLEKFLQLSKPLVALLESKNISHVCFSGVLRTGAYLQLLRYQTEMEARAADSEMRFCGVFRGAFDYLPIDSRFSHLDAIQNQCEATDLSTHHIEDSWAMKTPNLTTVPGAVLHHQAEFTSLGITDHTLNSRDPSRYIFGQDRYIGYFVEVMRICQQLVDKIRPLRFGTSEEQAMMRAEVEALLEAEKTSGILEVESFRDKVHSLKTTIEKKIEFAPQACRSLREIPFEVAATHLEQLPLYRRLELYLETGDLSHLQGFTKLSDYHYGIQDTDGNNLIFCTGIYNTPLIAGPSTRGIEGFPVSSTMEASYCSKELCARIRAFCGPNPVTYVGYGAAADSVAVMGRLHKNVSPEMAVSVVCVAPRLGEWGTQYRDASMDTDVRLKEQNQHHVDIVSIVSTNDLCFTERKLKKRLENRGVVLAFNTVSEPALSHATAVARKAAATAAKVEREDFSSYFGTSMRCLERYMTLRRVLESIFSERKRFEASATAASSGGREVPSSLRLTARKICEFIDHKTSMFPTRRFKQFLTAYGESAHVGSLNTKQDIQEYIEEIVDRREALVVEKKQLEEERAAFIREAPPEQEARLEEREGEQKHLKRQQAQLRALGENLEVVKQKIAQITTFLQRSKEAIEAIQESSGCQEGIKELVEAQHDESSRLPILLLESEALSARKRELEQGLSSLNRQQKEESAAVVRQEEIAHRIKKIDKTLEALCVIEKMVLNNIDIPEEALDSFAITTRRMPAHTRFTLMTDPKVRAGYAALQARYLFGKTPEYHLGFKADVGESRFAANSQNGARLVRDLATGKYAVVFKPVKVHLTLKELAKRKGGQISHTLVSHGGMLEMEQLHELWAQTLGDVLGVGCTLTEGGMTQLINGERGVALPFLTGYKSASQCQGLLERLHDKKQLGKVHDFCGINIISGDGDGHDENWMVLEEDGVLKDVRWIDAGNAFTWSDPSSWPWGGYSANYRAWKALSVSQKPFEGVFSRASLKQKLSSYDYEGVEEFASDVVANFKKKVNQGRFAELLAGNKQKKEHFELMLSRMQRRLEALLLYVCTDPKATPAGAAAYTYDQPQAWTRFTDWSVVSFIKNNKDTPFVN